MTQSSLVIFDCDGVLVDSEPIAARVFCEAICGLGLETTPAQVDNKYRGRSLSDCLRLLEAELVEKELGRHLPDHFLSRLTARTRQAFEEELTAVEHVHDAITRIVSALPVCVASSGSPSKIRHSLELTNLSELFERDRKLSSLGDNLFSAAQVKNGKPSPDLFLFAAEQMGCAPQSCVVVEDSLAGVTAACSAKMRVLAYRPECNKKGEALGQASADLEQMRALGAEPFSSMAQLPHLLGLSC